MEFNNLEYEVYRRNVKYPRLELKTGNLILVLPPGYSEKEILKKHEKWIRKKLQFVNECLCQAENKKIEHRSMEEFEKIVLHLVEINQDFLRVKCNKILFRKMKSKWGSLSQNGNITINKVAKYLPTYLIDYIIYHELAHAIEKHHNKRFKSIIMKKFKNFKELEKELFIYWFAINNETKKSRRR